MFNEIYDETKRLAEGKRLKNTLTIIYIYLIRVLISIIPVVLLEIIKFIFGVFKLVNLNFITNGFNFIYTILIAIVSFLTFIATSPFLFGGLNYFYNEVKDNKKENDNDTKLTKYLSNSKLCFKQMKMILYLSLGTILLSFLLVLPGIIFLLNYIMAPYVLIDDENMSIKNAMKESKRIMKGRRRTLFFGIIRILILPLILYILGTYFRLNPLLMVLGDLVLLAAFIVFLRYIGDVFVFISYLYIKVSGKRAGAIDVEYREIKD